MAAMMLGKLPLGGTFRIGLSSRCGFDEAGGRSLSDRHPVLPYHRKYRKVPGQARSLARPREAAA